MEKYYTTPSRNIPEVVHDKCTIDTRNPRMTPLPILTDIILQGQIKWFILIVVKVSSRKD